VGVVGILAGAAEGFLENHPGVTLPHRGTLLMGFGAVVALVGTYNSLAQFLEWRDCP
jgi:hypothetical protein